MLGLFGLIIAALAASNLADDYLFYILRIGGLTAVLGAVVAFPFTLIRLKYNERQTQSQEEGLITDRTHKAIEQLGHESPAVRLGAILQLERILRDSRQDRELVLNVLNAHIKHHQDDLKTEVDEIPIDVQAALDVLFRNK